MFIHTNQRNGHCMWTIDRADRANALGTTVAKELAQHLTSLKKLLTKKTNKPPLRSLTITATPVSKNDSAPIWIAGGDLKELVHLKTAKQARNYASTLSKLCFELENLPLPVIVAIDGSAIGGGAELALVGDMRIATKQSNFVFKQLDVGLATGYGGAHRLVHLVGKTWSQHLLYFGNALSAARAQEIGLVHDVHADTTALQNALQKIYDRLDTIDPQAFATQKLMLNRACDQTRTNALNTELALFEKLWRNPAHEKFLEKFTNKFK